MIVVIILIVASVVSALLGDYVEAAAIMAIVLLNAVIGVVQESRAEEALAALITRDSMIGVAKVALPGGKA